MIQYTPLYTYIHTYIYRIIIICTYVHESYHKILFTYRIMVHIFTNYAYDWPIAGVEQETTGKQAPPPPPQPQQQKKEEEQQQKNAYIKNIIYIYINAYTHVCLSHAPLNPWNLCMCLLIQGYGCVQGISTNSITFCLYRLYSWMVCSDSG